MKEHRTPVTDPTEIAKLKAMGKYRVVHWNYVGDVIWAVSSELREWRIASGKIR